MTVLPFNVLRLGPSDVVKLRRLNALYSKLGRREAVMHFDIATEERRPPPP